MSLPSLSSNYKYQQSSVRASDPVISLSKSREKDHLFVLQKYTTVSVNDCIGDTLRRRWHEIMGTAQPEVVFDTIIELSLYNGNLSTVPCNSLFCIPNAVWACYESYHLPSSLGIQSNPLPNASISNIVEVS